MFTVKLVMGAEMAEGGGRGENGFGARIVNRLLLGRTTKHTAMRERTSQYLLRELDIPAACSFHLPRTKEGTSDRGCSWQCFFSKP